MAEKTPPIPPIDLPEEFLRRMGNLLKEEFPAFLEAYGHRPSMGLRANRLKVSPPRLRELLPFTLEPIAAARDGFLVTEQAAPGRHPYHAAGLYYLQEPSAMVPAEVLGPRPGELILDLAAAPGGKSTQLAALIEGKGVLVSNEIHPRRVRDLIENIERLGVRNAVVTQEHPARLADRLAGVFDRVLVDAPCSGEGMFRRSASARAEWMPGLVESCQRRQGLILDSAAKLVRPGGRMVYSTCTFSPEENEGVVEGFLRRNRAYALEDIAMQPGFSRGWRTWEGGPQLEAELERTVRLWPHRGPWEGHFVARLRRLDGDERLSLRSVAWPNGKIRDLDPVQQFWRQYLGEEFPAERAVLRGRQVFLLPAEGTELTGLRVVRPGWWVGSLSSNRFEPSHALAMAWPGEKAGGMLSFDAESPLISAYLRGEVLDIPGDAGWVIIAVGGHPLGWGKQTRGKVKNHYPHWLRTK